MCVHIETGNLDGKTVGDVVLNLIKGAVGWKAKLYNIKENAVLLAVWGKPSVYGLGERVKVGNVEMFAYKLADGVYQFDVSGYGKEFSVVLVWSEDVAIVPNMALSIKEELDEGEADVTPNIRVWVVDAYKSRIGDLDIYELEGHGLRGVAKYSKKSGVMAIELWTSDARASRVVFVML